MLRAGVVVAMATGALLGTSAPALAAPPDVAITSVSSGTLQAGGPPATVKFTVNDSDKPNGSVTIIVTFEGIATGAISCSGPCNTTETVQPSDWPKPYEIKIAAASGAQSDEGTLKISATVDGETRSATRAITVQAQQQAPQAVPTVTGTVNDITSGKIIAGAIVVMQDGDGTDFNMQTNSLGRFTFTSTPAKPITPGTLLLLADKDGFEKPTEPTRVEGRAGQPAATKITLRSVAAATTAPPATTEAAPTTTDTAAPTNDAVSAGNNEDSGGGMLSWLLIGMGGLLVALGIGAIALLLLRRRDDGDEADGTVPHPGPRGPAPRPGAAGVYRSGGPDPTMVQRAPAIGDRTMVTRPAIADAPTAMHRPAVDEFPDPYNPQGAYGAPPPGYAPPPQQPGYAPQPQPGYGPPQQAYGSPVDPYGRGQEYDGYDRGGYQQGPGYPPNGGYQQPTPQAQYEPEPYGQGRHEQQAYDQGYQGGYEQAGGGYDQAGGYVPEQRSGQGQDGYDGYYDDQRGPQGQQGQQGQQRRPLDWLDD